MDSAGGEEGARKGDQDGSSDDPEAIIQDSDGPSREGALIRYAAPADPLQPFNENYNGGRGAGGTGTEQAWRAGDMSSAGGGNKEDQDGSSDDPNLEALIQVDAVASQVEKNVYFDAKKLDTLLRHGDWIGLEDHLKEFIISVEPQTKGEAVHECHPLLMMHARRQSVLALVLENKIEAALNCFQIYVKPLLNAHGPYAPIGNCIKQEVEDISEAINQRDGSSKLNSAMIYEKIYDYVKLYFPHTISHNVMDGLKTRNKLWNLAEPLVDEQGQIVRVGGKIKFRCLACGWTGGSTTGIASMVPHIYGGKPSSCKMITEKLLELLPPTTVSNRQVTVHPNVSRKRKNTSGCSSIPTLHSYGMPIASIEGSIGSIVLAYELTMSKLLDRVSDALNGTPIRGTMISEFEGARKCLQSINEQCIIARTCGENGVLDTQQIESELHKLRGIMKDINLRVYNDFNSENDSLDLILKLNQEIDNLEAVCMKAIVTPQAAGPHLRSKLPSSSETGHLAQDNANINIAPNFENSAIQINVPCLRPNPSFSHGEANWVTCLEEFLDLSPTAFKEAGPGTQSIKGSETLIAGLDVNATDLPPSAAGEASSAATEATGREAQGDDAAAAHLPTTNEREETAAAAARSNTETLIAGLDVNATDLPLPVAGEASSEGTGREAQVDDAAAEHQPATNKQEATAASAAGSNTSDQAP